MVMVESGENAEFITIKAAFEAKQIRTILAYGPQEGSSMQDIEKEMCMTLVQMAKNFKVFSNF